MMGAPGEQPAQPDAEEAAILREAQALNDAAAADLAPPPDPNAPKPLPPLDPVEEIRDVLDFAHASLTPLYPSLDAVYTEPVRQKIAVAGARVLQKYGISMADFLGAWAPEIGLAMVIVPLVYPTVQAIRHDRAQAAKPPEPPKVEQTSDGTAKFPEPPAGGNPMERFGQ